MKRYACTTDLVTDEVKIAEYLAHHRAVWPEVVLSFAAVGVLDLRIWRFGTRMFYELEVTDDFDPARDFARYAAMHPSNPVWEAFMASGFQNPLPGRKPGENWASMEPAFSLADHVAAVKTGKGLRIDAHQHFWQYTDAQFSWIPEGPVRRDFGPADLQPRLSASSLSGCVAVQARCEEKENDYLLGLADKHPFILGVVGWLDLSADNLAERLDAQNGRRRLVGFREILQGKPSETFLNDRFVRGLRLLGERDYAYDVLVYANQLDAARELVARALPGQRLVLDHLAKPDIAKGEHKEWATKIRALAKDFPGLHCKLSGMVTEAAPGWRAADLRPYMETVLEAFGPDRVMYGSDWPVCLLNAPDYATVHDVAADYIRTLGPDAESAVFGGNALRFYKLPLPTL